MWSLDLADSATLEILLEMQYFRSTPDLLNQFLYFKMPPSYLYSYKKIEKH